jgi:hypothetical protein
MARRFYLPSSGTAALTPTANAAWSHVNAVYRPMSVTKGGTASASSTYSPDAADHLVAGDAVNVTFVSTEVLAAQTITAQAVKLAIQASETNAGNNLSLAWEVYAVTSNGTVRGTLVSKRTAGTELPTAITGRFASVTCAALAVQDGDRLVLRVGYSGTPVGAGGVQGHNGTVRLMDVNAQGDLPESDGSTSAILNPWLEFANDLAWQQAQGTTGSLAVTLGALALAATATLGVSGSTTATLGAASVASTGVVSVAGSTSSALNAASVTSAGATGVSGGSSLALGAAGLSSAGATSIAGTAAATLGPASATSTGTAAVSGSVASIFSPATVTGAGSVGSATVSGALATTLGPASLAATGTPGIAGACDAPLGACEVVGAGWATVAGAAAGQLAPASLAASGAVATVGEPTPEPVPTQQRTMGVAGEIRAHAVPPNPRTSVAE